MKRTSQLLCLVVVIVLMLALAAPAQTVNCSGVAAWSANSVSYSVGALVTYQGSEYKCIQAHTSEAGWDPVDVPALWSLVGSCSGSSATPTPTPTPTATATPTAKPTATATPSGCTPTSITPYIQVNGGSWQQTASATVSAGASVNLGPQPVTGGSWSWTGPNGYSSTSRQIAITVNSTSTYTATYTNSSGCKSTQTFTLTVSGGATPTPTPTPTPTACTPTAITPYVQVNGGSWQQTASATVSAGASVNLGPQPVTGGSWSWTGPNGYTSTSRQIAITVNSTSTYTATYTNSNGCKSTQTFTLTVSAATPTPTPSTGGVIGDCGMAPNGAGTGNVDYVMVYKSNWTVWCVDSTYWPANASAISQFFAFSDSFIQEDISLFQFTPSASDNLGSGLPFIIQVTTPTGGAHTGCNFGPPSSLNNSGFCDTVTGDAYSDVYNDPVTNAPIPGFYGYLLTMHESINVFTGLVASGWPRDWWADDRSPFPNAIDAEMMQTIGTQQNNSTLLAAAKAQFERFTDTSNPSGEYDSEVVMDVGFYNQFGGFSAYENGFKLMEEDGFVDWGTVASANPSPQLTEYVIAYLQLGFGTTTDLTQSTFVADGVGTLDTTVPSYSVDSSVVLAVANAHCAVQAANGAGVNVSTALSNLQNGNYSAATIGGGTQSTCPSECTWKGSACVAKW